MQRFIQFILVALCFFSLTECQKKQDVLKSYVLQKPIYKNKDLVEITSIYDTLLNNYDPQSYFESWSLDTINKEITLNTKNKKALLNYFNHSVILKLNDFPKSAQSDVTYSSFAEFIANNEITINGKSFSGVIIGISPQSDEIVFKSCIYNSVCVYQYEVADKNLKAKTVYFPIPQVVDVKVVRKPVIYCYNALTENIELEIAADVNFTTVYPPFNAGPASWLFNTTKDGIISINDKKYPYLFWEGDMQFEEKLDSGFVVKKANLIPFLEEKLSAIGLNYKEQTDFITYWLPELMKNEYSLIKFSTAYEHLVQLNTKPEADCVLRVFMLFKKTDGHTPIPEQAIKKVDRQGFIIVEWGGMNMDNDTKYF